MEKAAARKMIFQKRKFLTLEEYTKKSRAVEEQLWKYLKENFKETEILEMYLYCSYKNEVDTWNIIDTCLEKKWHIAVPKSDGRTCQMQFYYIRSYKDLTEGYMGIREPLTSCKKACPNTSENKKRILIMPGVAFDIKRNRAGYGKGFYDRYLSVYSFDKVIALAFEFQIVENILCDNQDKKPDCIITEQRIIL